MFQIQSTRLVLAIFTLSTLLITYSPSTFAQITNGAANDGAQFGSPQGIRFDSSNHQATDESAALTEALQLNYDWYFGMPLKPSTGDALVHGELPFAVGNIPVQVSNFNFHYNAKWVNGGGDAVNPSTTWTAVGSLIYSTSLSPQPNDPVVYRFSVTNGLTGNGFLIDTESGPSTLPAPYVLGSNSNYFLTIKVTTNMTIDNTFSNTTVPIVVTNEAGGQFGDNFSGFNVSFDWHTVPEPDSLALAASALLGLTTFVLMQRKRKQIAR